MRDWTWIWIRRKITNASGNYSLELQVESVQVLNTVAIQTHLFRSAVFVILRTLNRSETTHCNHGSQRCALRAAAFGQPGSTRARNPCRDEQLRAAGHF